MKLKTSSRTLALALSVPVLLGVVGCDRRSTELADRERTPGEEVDDKNLSANVRNALSVDSVKYPDVQVAAYRGVVQLSGFVDTREHKSRAADITKNVPGVRKVDNNISIKEEK